jgi:hypothetical protein
MQMTEQRMRGLLSLVSASTCLLVATLAWADEPTQTPHHQVDAGAPDRPCTAATQDPATSVRFDGVQVETSDIGLFEQFFEAVLQAPVVQHADHPQADRLRGYCYRGVLIVVRQDLRTVRPTGWVQLNFRVSDVAAVQKEIERVYRASSVSQLAEADQAKIVRFRFKPDVMRGDRKVSRFEVAGPEGFMIGFDQAK